MELCGDPAFVVHMLEQIEPTQTEVLVVQILLNSLTLREGLLQWNRFAKVNFEGDEFELIEGEHQAEYVQTLYQDDYPIQAIEIHFIGFAYIMRILKSPSLTGGPTRS